MIHVVGLMPRDDPRSMLDVADAGFDFWRALVARHDPPPLTLADRFDAWRPAWMRYGACRGTGQAAFSPDRGGPVRRTQAPKHDLPPADFRFPQDEDHDAITEVAARSSQTSGWAPGFIDYLYVSVTNSSAFSPTDSMPLSPRAKLLMGTESVSAIVLSVLVIAHGVSILQ